MQRLLRGSFVRGYSTLEKAYFTGNPAYYNHLFKLNQLLAKYHKPTTTETPAETKKIQWLNKFEMDQKREMKMNDKTYEDFINKLDALSTVKEASPEIPTLLEKFIKPNQTLSSSETKLPSLDEHGRSLTIASRKSAKAQVWMVPTNDGKPGRILINSLDITKYFKSVDDIKTTIIPLKLVRRLGEFNIWCVVENGGSSSQAEALMVAIARGLCIHDPLLKPLLETVGLTKIDTRHIERKKTGQPGARKKYRWVKR